MRLAPKKRCLVHSRPARRTRASFEAAASDGEACETTAYLVEEAEKRAVRPRAIEVANSWDDLISRAFPVVASVLVMQVWMNPVTSQWRRERCAIHVLTELLLRR